MQAALRILRALAGRKRRRPSATVINNIRHWSLA